MRIRKVTDTGRYFLLNIQMKKVNIEYSILNTEVQECLGACKGLDCALIALCDVMNGRRCSTAV